MKRCIPCKLRYSDNEVFCARCGNPLSTPLTSWQEWRIPLIVFGSISVVAGVMWAIALLVRPPHQELSRQVATSAGAPTPNTPKPVTASPSREPTRTIAESPIDSFRRKLMSIPDSENLILSVQRSEVEGVARVQVTNIWFDARPHQKRQLTQLMANLWKSEMGDQPAILHIYDITGREIAGTRVFGGVWIEDE